MTLIKKQDFVEIEYTGKTKEGNMIFDTTDEKTAKDNNIHKEEMTYGPVVVCVGEGQVIKGLDEELVGKETGKNYTIEIEPEKAFGKKSAKLVQLINTNKFKQQGVEPMPGLQVAIDGMVGTIKTVSGGRTLVDFNHPLASKIIVYDVKVKRLVTDDKEKLRSYIKLQINEKPIVEITEKKAKVTIKKEVPKEAQEELNKNIKRLIPSIESIELVKEKEMSEAKKQEIKKGSNEGTTEKKTTEIKKEKEPNAETTR